MTASEGGKFATHVGIVAMLLVSTCFAVGVAPAAGPPQENTKVENKLWAAVTVSHPIFEAGRANASDPFTVNFGLMNEGGTIVDPGVESSQLVVNGVELKDWPFIINNGPRDENWKALKAKDCLSFRYAMGEQFQKPGVYRLSWKGKGFQTAEVVFRVSPKPGS